VFLLIAAVELTKVIQPAASYSRRAIDSIQAN